MIAGAEQAASGEEARSYEIEMKLSGLPVASVSIATTANHDGKAEQVESRSYRKSCVTNTKEKFKKGFFSTGYQFSVLPDSTDRMTFNWYASYLESMEEGSVDNCPIDLPKITGVGGKRLIVLPVGATTEFTEGKYVITVKRTK